MCPIPDLPPNCAHWCSLVLTFTLLWICRNTKKCRDKVSSLEKDLQDTEAKMEELKVRLGRTGRTPFHKEVFTVIIV